MPKKAIQKTATNTVGSGLQPFDRPFNGKLITSEDPCLIGREDFTALKNLRYNDTGIEGVKGMSKINTTGLNDSATPTAHFLTIKTGHHFHKDFPATEDHVLVQGTYSTTNILYDNDGTAIPAADEFTALYSNLSTGATTARISDIPNGSVMICDGEKNWIWSGDEHKVGAVIASTADITTTITNPTDYSDKMRNSYEGDVLVVSGADSYTKMLLHLDGTDASTTFTDAIGTHTPAAGGGTNAQIDTAYQKFGTGSLLLDGTGDRLEVADHADFSFGTGDFTIDFWVRFNALPSSGPGNEHYFYSHNDGTDFALLYITNSSGVYYLSMSFYNGGNKGAYSRQISITTGQWHHVAFVRNGANGYIFYDGSSAGTTEVIAFAANDLGDPASAVYIGSDSSPSNYLNGWIDEFRVSKGIARWTSSSFAVPTSPYTSVRASMIIGSTRPLQGAKFYVQSPNTIASTMTVSEWQGSSWSALSITDNTKPSTISLAQTGTVTWSTTVNTSKMRYFAGYYLYWYKVSISAGEATLYMITTNPPFQEYKDAWDGQMRPCLSCLDTALADYTIQTLETDMGIFGTDTDTYMNIGGFTSSSYLYLGFLEKVTAIQFSMPSSYVNAVAAVLSVAYWDGISWTAVSDQVDGTSVGGKTFAQSGVVSWRYDDINHSKKTLVGATPYYYYRVGNSVASALTDNTSIDSIQGIPTAASIKPFKIPVTWQDRTWMLNEISGRVNLALGSAADLPESMNGTDSVELLIGDDTEIVSAVTLYTRYGSNIYDNLIVCKKSATHLIDGYSPETFRIYTVSDTVGCVAPLTMRRCDVNYELGEEGGTTKHVVIWQAAHGLVMTDGNTITTISDDIENFFDPDDSDYISVSLMAKFYGFYDKMKQEYHWLFGTGSDTTLTREFVYDLRKKKWYEMSRSTYYLQCGIPVADSYGFGYCYGGTTGGQIYRLENTGQWDATDITYTITSSDTPIANSMMVEAEARKIKLVAKSKTSAEEVTITWYTDGAASGTALTTINQTKASRRYYDAVRSFTAKGVTHKYSITVTTDNGFDPLMISGLYRPTRADIISKND